MIPTIRSLLGTLPQAFFRSICGPYCQTASQSLVAPVPPLHFIVNLSWENIYVPTLTITSGTFWPVVCLYYLTYIFSFHYLFFVHVIARVFFFLLIYSLYMGLY